MKTVRLPRENIYKGVLLLVNAALPLQFEENRDLTSADLAFPDVLIKREAANVLQMIFKRIGCRDKIVPVSGYRSSAEQTEIYNTSLKESGEDFTRKFVALPYHSEHQTGLAIDLGLMQEKIDFICPDFPYEGICDEFRNAAPHYGFIERYPKGKETITGIAHEPWHFRYVGYPHSEIMLEFKLTLEEYTDFIKQYPYEGTHLRTRKNGKSIEVFYVSAKETDATIMLLEKTVYQVSGNNADGFIVTLWRNDNE
ncbi:MAG: M15 family metallopeptidase [Lachnospiraceae bacterium]